MNIAIPALFLFAAAVLQTLVPAVLPLLTGLTVVLAAHAGRKSALAFALAAGLLHDALSPAPIGLSLPIFAGLAGGVLRIRNRIYLDRIFSYAAAGGCAGLLQELYYAVCFFFSGLRPVGAPGLVSRPAFAFLFGALCTPVIALVYRLVTRRSAAERLYG